MQWITCRTFPMKSGQVNFLHLSEIKSSKTAQKWTRNGTTTILPFYFTLSSTLSLLEKFNPNKLFFFFQKIYLDSGNLETNCITLPTFVTKKAQENEMYLKSWIFLSVWQKCHEKRPKYHNLPGAKLLLLLSFPQVQESAQRDEDQSALQKRTPGTIKRRQFRTRRQGGRQRTVQKASSQPKFTEF